MAKLSKAQQEVLDNAKERIDYARTHSFCDWFRHNWGCYYKDMTDAEVYEAIEKMAKRSKVYSLQREEMQYDWNRNGIDYLCHASTATIKKLEKLGLIEIIYDSNGEYYGFDTIKILNY